MDMQERKRELLERLLICVCIPQDDQEADYSIKNTLLYLGAKTCHYKRIFNGLLTIAKVIAAEASRCYF